MNKLLIRRRKVTNTVALSMAVGAAAFGLFWLVAILWTLFANGFDAICLLYTSDAADE